MLKNLLLGLVVFVLLILAITFGYDLNRKIKYHYSYSTLVKSEIYSIVKEECIKGRK